MAEIEESLRLGENPEISIVPRPRGTRGPNPGFAFWRKLNPERQAALAKPLREVELSVAQYFPEGFKSPLVANIDQARDRGDLEKQTDGTSCTYHATANALRLLDAPKPEYSKDQLKAKLETITKHPEINIYKNDLAMILDSGFPYNQFSVREAPEMAALFIALSKGAVGVAGWFQTPEGLVIPHPGSLSHKITHARTIAGFEKGPDNRLFVHVIDPYGARHEIWSFRDFYVALQMDTFGNERGHSDQDIAGYAANIRKPGMIGSTDATASRVWLIDKKKISLVIKRATPRKSLILRKSA